MEPARDRLVAGAWSLADSAFLAGAKGYSASSYWVAGVLAAVVFLISITAHELGHSVVAQRRGIKVRSITLWLFGGVARLDRRPQTWRDEMSVALAGPAPPHHGRHRHTRNAGGHRQADEMLLDALERTDNTHRRIVVVDDASHVIGLITPTDPARTVRVARLQDSLKV